MAKQLKSPSLELEQLLNNRVEPFTDVFRDMMLATLRGDGVKFNKSFEQWTELLREAMILSDLIGRRRINLELQRFHKLPTDQQRCVTSEWMYSLQYQDTPSLVIPDVPFTEAVADILRRTPAATGTLTTAEEVAAAYSQRTVFATARVTEENLRGQIRDLIGRGVVGGLTSDEATEEITKLIRNKDESENQTRAYAENVYRTNANTAYTSGRFQEASKPHINNFFPALKLVTARDASVRDGDVTSQGITENHAALDGLIMGTSDSAWGIYAPPNGYQCRCTVVMVRRAELESKGLIDEFGTVKRSFEPNQNWVHPNFRSGRPDKNFYTVQQGI